MTRVRSFALAMLVGACCLAPTPIFAQSGPAASAYGPDPGIPPNGGYPTPLFQAPVPMAQEPYFGRADEVEPSNYRAGPLVKTDGGFLRVEYLNYNIGNPGNVLLGAPVAGVTHPDVPFVVFSPGGSTAVALATVPTTNGMNLGNNSGLQVTGGMNFIEGGSVEVSAFMLARKESGFKLGTGGLVAFDNDFDGDLDPPAVELAEGEAIPSNIATSTLFNGHMSDHLFLYNVSYEAVFQSQLWGTEANYFYDYDAVGMLQFRPLIGARYLNLSERLTQIGVFQDTLLGGPPIITTIGSQTTNNLWGGQIGARLEVVTKYLQVGITPKILFLGDTMTVNVFSNHLRSNADPTVGFNDVTTKFTFGGDVGTYAQINLSPNFSVRGGYNLLALGKVTRPQRDIVYNDNGPTAPVALTGQVDRHGIFISGFTVGAEFRY